MVPLLLPISASLGIRWACVISPSFKYHQCFLLRMSVLPCDEGLVVLMTHPQQICIRGRARVRVLAGEMSVMGHTMDAKGSRTYDLFSPTTSSLLTIHTCSAEKEKKVGGSKSVFACYCSF